MTLFSKHAVVIALGICFYLPSIHANVPFCKSLTLRTDHFDIIYCTQHQELAKIYAAAAEQSYELLKTAFSEAPSRTMVVLNDDTDMANGSATFLPYPLINVNLALPGANESISDYGDWAFEIMLHEYTHILNMNSAHGWMTPLKYIFGNIIRPNGILPRWYHEGLAVNTESRFSDFGRLRSPDTGARWRAAVEGDLLKIETIDRVNESGIPTWPYGDRPYLMGAAWWNAAYTDAKVPDDLNQRYSRRLPFFINGPLEDRLNKNASQILEKTYANITASVQEQFKAIENAGGENLQSLSGETSPGLNLPTLSPDGLKLAYVASKFKEANSIRLVERASTQEKFALSAARTIARTTNTSKLSWLPDSSGLVYDSIDTQRPHVTYSDLYLLPLNQEPQRLSFNLRASQPCVSPSGQDVALILNQNARHTLAIMNLKSKRTKIVYKAKQHERLSSPTYFADKIYFIKRTVLGTDHLAKLDLNKNAVELVPLNLKSLNFIAHANNSLLLGSSQTGATNIYKWSPGQEHPEPVTNTKTEIASATYDQTQNELIVSRLTGTGHQLYTSPYKITRPPQLEPIYKVEKAPPRPSLEPKTEELSFQPIRYLAPTYWLPFVYPVEGGMLFQGVTSGSDPLERNQYSLAGNYDTVTKKGGYGVNYLNKSTPTEIGLSYTQFQSYLGASNLTLENQSADLDLGFFLSSHNKFWRGHLTGSWDQISSQDHLRRLGPGGQIEYNRLESPFRSWGWAMSLGHQEFIKQDGYINYGISNARLAFKTGTTSTNSQHLLIDLKGAVAPQLPFSEVITLGERSLGANYLVNLSGSTYLLRGYPSGTYVGRKLLNANLEYDFPISGFWQGSGTMPLFFKNLGAAIFFDTLAVDGGAYKIGDGPATSGYFRSRLSEFYSGTGMEFRLNTTAAYHLPLTFTLGLYYGLKDEYGGGFTTFFGIGYQGLSAIDR